MQVNNMGDITKESTIFKLNSYARLYWTRLKSLIPLHLAKSCHVLVENGSIITSLGFLAGLFFQNR